MVMGIGVFIIVLLVVVIVHEFGHFIIAKKSGIRVDEFGFGFPPRVFGKKIGETVYSLNLLPVGGFVRIFGENPEEVSAKDPDTKRSFTHKSKWVQASVLIGGVLFNFLLAWVLFITIYLMGAPYSVSDTLPKGATVEDARLTVTYVLPESPAEQAGLKAGDAIEWIRAEDGRVIVEPTDAQVQAFIADHSYTPVTVAYKRGDALMDAVDVVPEMNDRLGRPAIGITMDTVGRLHVSPYRAVIEGTKTTVSMTGATAVGLFDFFSSVLSGGANFEEVTGPVGIVGIVGDASRLGIVSVLIITAVISINLALINLLPFPALDGGRLFFLSAEAATRRPIKPSVVQTVNSVGFFLLLLLMAFITYHDIMKMF